MHQIAFLEEGGDGGGGKGKEGEGKERKDKEGVEGPLFYGSSIRPWNYYYYVRMLAWLLVGDVSRNVYQCGVVAETETVIQQQRNVE